MKRLSTLLSAQFKTLLRLVVILIGLAGQSFAGKNISDQTNFIRIDTSLALTVDPTGWVSVQKEEGVWPAPSDFDSLDLSGPSALHKLGQRKATFTLRITVTNHTNQELVSAIRHFGKVNRTFIKVVNSDSGKELNGQSIVSSFFGAGRVTFPPGVNTVYLRYENFWSGNLPKYIDVLPEFLLEDDKVQHFFSFNNIIFPLIIFDFLLIYQILYVIIQWYYNKRRDYLYYILYLLTIALYFWNRSVDAMVIQPLHDMLMNISGLINSTMLILPYYFYLKFARSFLEMHEKHPGMNKTIEKSEKIVLLLTSIVIGSYFFGQEGFSFRFTYISVIILFIFTLYLIRFFFRQQNKLNRIFLIGSLFASTGHVVAMTLSLSPELWSYFPPIVATMIGISFEIFYFNTGLGYKAKYEQEEKIKVQASLISQLDRNRKIQERMQEMRNRIASDLHDDVGSTLSSIGLYSEVAAKQIDADPVAAKSILNKISESSRRMMDAMSDIVWAIHTRPDEAGGLSTRMIRFAGERLAPAGIRFELDKDAETEKLNLSIEARRNLLLLFKEAVNNSAKYSGANLISASLNIKEGIFEMKITDNGKGFDPGIPKTGNGLSTMKNRAQQLGGQFHISSVTGSGTVISVTIPFSKLTLDGNSNHLN